MDWNQIFQNTVRAAVGVDAIYFAIAAIGLNVQFGYTGLVNFGQAAFMACGSYGLGMTAQYFGIGLWWGIPLGIVCVIVLALIVGIPTLRLRADYLAIVTIATAEIVRLFVRSVKFNKVFGGTEGISNFSREYRDLNPFEPGRTYGFAPFRFSGYTLITIIVGWVLVAIFATLVWQLMRSPWGRVIKGIREDEDAVRSLGKNVYAYKMQSLIIGGIIGMFAGMVLALDRGSVQPDNYSRDVTFYVLTALVLGGLAKVSGSIFGSMLFWVLFVLSDNILREITRNGPLRIGDFTVIQSTQVGAVNYMFVGLGLMLLMTYRPQGLFGNRKEMALDGR
ncbi:branched-chain amino acid ABC transporter permease [Actinomycetes bacterium]|nr:branched-chain amino acid ABC transporter permease [Actinomycetes bacterium]